MSCPHFSPHFFRFKKNQMVVALWAPNGKQGRQEWCPACIEALPTPFLKKYKVVWYVQTESGLEIEWVDKERKEYSWSWCSTDEIRLPEEASVKPRFTPETLPPRRSDVWLYFSEVQKRAAKDGKKVKFATCCVEEKGKK